MKKNWLLASLILLAALTPSCANPRPKADEKVAAKLASLTYPKDAPLGDDLDIVVERGKSHIRLINRTPRSYQNATLWLNQQYVGEAVRIDIGSTKNNRLSLKKFTNQHGECFPIAGFLAPEKAQQLVLAELIDPQTGQRHRLLVQIAE
ncbi:MAG: hypothetical protein IT443_01590 [Phycisphaeraceae bacterium]|nr:hypothetical protein [Phycisphaeraceae bacterium]